MKNPISFINMEVKEISPETLEYHGSCLSCHRGIVEEVQRGQVDHKGIIVCPYCGERHYRSDFRAGKLGKMSAWVKECHAIDVVKGRIKFKVKTGEIYCEGFTQKEEGVEDK